MSHDEPDHYGFARRDQFGSTHWSIVLEAAHESSPHSDEALATLCQTYWYPLYAYVRLRVSDVHEAQDMTQEFFTRLLEKNYLAQVTPDRGRFRSFLLTVFKHFLANEWKKARAQKRGGGQSDVSLDLASAETRFSLEPSDDLTPEKLYDKQWAETLVQHVLDVLRGEYVRGGREETFDRLKSFLGGHGRSDSYAAVAAQLGMSEGAVRVALHRMRQRYRELLRSEIAQTVSTQSEVDDEIRSLFAILGSKWVGATWRGTGLPNLK